MREEIDFVLRLAELPRPAGEKHEMDPPHDLCLGDDPCICIHLAACEQRVLLDAIAAIDEQHQLLWSANTLVRLGMGIARAAVIKLIQKKP